jgi:SAM-dependent methyltransferase
MWKIKVLIQFFLSKLPGGEKVNYLLQQINRSHSREKIWDRVVPLLNILMKINKHFRLNDVSVVEIGTGWQPIWPILLYMMGVKTCHTYDHIRHIRYKSVKTTIEVINDQLNNISNISSIPIDILKSRLSRLKNSADIDELFLAVNIIYHAPANAAKTGLEDNSVDLVLSYAVLEHLPQTVVHDLINETKRILKSSGIAYHMIGLHDHYAGFDKKVSKVNFLKYPEPLWSFFIHNSISHHNRLREKQFVDIFRSHGAKILWTENKIDQSDISILKNMKIDSFFNAMSHKELAVYQTEVIFSFS